MCKTSKHTNPWSACWRAGGEQGWGGGGGGAEARETFQPSFEGVTRLNSIAPPIPLGSDTTAVCLPAHTHINILQRFAVVQVRRGL